VRRRTTWLVVLALVLSVVAAAPAAAMHRDGPAERATFNVPAPWGTRGEQFRIIHRIEKAINQTPPRTGGRRSRIYISTFLLDRVLSVNALVRACKRGVSVRVVMDGDIVSGPSHRLMRVLNADNVKDRNRDGKPDHKPRRGPCDTKLPKKHKHHHKNKHGKHDGKKGKHDRKNKKNDKGGDKGDRPKHHDKQRKHDHKSKHDSKHKKGDKPKHHKKHKHKHKDKPKPLTRAQTWGHDRSFAIKCKGTCRGRGYGGNMHSKFYAFSRVRHIHNVVMVSSSNLNVGGGTLGWNDLWTMKDRPVQFRYYAQIFDQMIRDRVVRHGHYEVKEGPYRTRFFPLVHPKKKNDPTLLDLDRVHCHGPLGPTKIFVSMFYWKGPRGEYLATKLLNLRRDGCQVSVIYGAPSRLIAARLKSDARRHVINLWDSRLDRNFDGIFDTRTHAKYVLIKGHFGRHKKAWRVFTGSQNWVEGSLGLSDETTLNIASRKAYGMYIKNWNTIRLHSRHVQ
jgi:PLD-like domain